MNDKEFYKNTKNLSPLKKLQIGAFVEAYCFMEWAIHQKGMQRWIKKYSQEVQER